MPRSVVRGQHQKKAAHGKWVSGTPPFGLDYVRTDPSLLRPAEVEHLIGDSSKARQVLGWTPSVEFAALVRMMVDADLERLRTAPSRLDAALSKPQA